jgi:ParB-like chromosome segregation protein Spo0J
MGREYSQFSIEERREIARLSADGHSIRQIAAALDRQASSVARELKRNRGRTAGYQADYALAQAKARRWTGGKLDRNETLRDMVLAQLRRGWSSSSSSPPTTTPHANALIGKLQPRHSLNNCCCTSNESPHPGFRRGDDVGRGATRRTLPTG